MAMARGHLSLGQSSPCLITDGIKMPNLPCEQTLPKPTPGPSATQWVEDFIRRNKPKITLLISTSDSSELTIPPFVEPSKPNEPPIPSLSQPSEPHEDTLTCEPEPEVAPTQSMEEPFACPSTPASVIIISNRPIRSPLPPLLPQRSQMPPSLIPKMRLGRNLWTCN
ncbi:hypothetical protein O181_101599 [Austropuccinia psidii MF-1]|uniref:Uncharacterized protein n=1 Tax=Austropuccinia psidii MF-1 TaxID=1389203 RepID=A0A9Q3JGV8_9BASI|nr:hypothetical protein [Austropuccinia psidii MF-1]